MKLIQLVKQYKVTLTILVLALFIRLLFLFWGAELYFNRENIFVDGDTGAWQVGFENLINTGEYTNNPDNDRGIFGRLPGYPLFMGLFYYLSGKNWDIAYKLIAYCQILLDVISVLLVFKIGLRLFNKKTAIISSVLYALYPFIIVWNPVVYSESLSVFFMLSGIYFFINGNERNFWNYLFSGMILGFGILLRPQLLFLIVVLGIYLIINYKKDKKSFFKKAVFFTIGVLITYGYWPVRNYVKSGEIVLTQDMRGLGGNWDTDVISFLQYIYSVKAEWDPQFTAIIKNETVEWPANAYTSYEDSLMLERAVHLSKNCGSGFSEWRGYWKDVVPAEMACNEEISQLYNHLREVQIKTHPLNFYLIIPAKNLKKAVFKSDLKYETSTGFAQKLSSLLFLYRTILILLGLIGVFMLFKEKNNKAWIFLLYFLLLYITLCAGTSIQMRNIEIRYFLHADILLLIPGSYYIVQILNKLLNSRFIKKIKKHENNSNYNSLF